MSDGEKMMRQAEQGDKMAAQILTLYDLHRKCPADPGAYGLFEAAYKEWKKRGSAEDSQPSNHDEVARAVNDEG